MRYLLLFLCLVAFVVARPKWHELDTYHFDLYVRDFQKSYETEEYAWRRDIFESRLEQIKKHNAAGLGWKNGVNQFTDMTNEERQKVNGLNRLMLYRDTTPAKQIKLLGEIKASVDWREAGIISAVKDQGRCGSCWTFGTTETVEAYVALKTNKLFVLSEQQILDCTPNPQDCGGTGGCEGGTAVLALSKLISRGGQTTEWMYPYVSYWGQDQPKCLFNASKTVPYADVKGFHKFDSNQEEPMLQHLSSVGPLIVNVDASSWQDYETGVYDGCNQTNPTIDHVVQLVGYGTDSATGNDYWLVRNSWNPSWGEDGYIRLARPAKLRCGVDLNPLEGTGCKDGPPTQTVCGTCGIAFHVVYPEV